MKSDTIMTSAELEQLRRVATTLTHVIKDARRGVDPETLARRVSELAETIAYLVDRAEARRGTN